MASVLIASNAWKKRKPGNRENIMSLILHCGGQPASLAEVMAVPIPEATDTWQPVAHMDVIDLVKRETELRLGLDKCEAKYGLNREGKQLFATFTYDVFSNDNPRNNVAQQLIERFQHATPVASADIDTIRQYGLTVAVRNSTDKSISIAMAGGTSVFVCDNLSFSGNCVKVMRKHTPNVWQSFKGMVMAAVEDMAEHYMHDVVFQEMLRATPITKDTAFGLVGQALGYGRITPRQATRIIEDYQNQQKQEFHPFHEQRRNAFGAYQSFTEGLKMGRSLDKVGQHRRVSDLFQSRVIDVDYRVVND
jgi:hypothetical protein